MTTSVQRLRVPVGVAVAALLIVTLLLPHLHATTTTGHWQTPFPVLVLGMISGVPFGLLGVGLVLVYRTNRLINFAHGDVGAFAAAFFGLLVVRWHIPYWVALPIALAIAGGVGATAEVAVVRRLRKAPRLMSMVATLGIGQFLVLLAFALNSSAAHGLSFPQPAGMPSFHIGHLLVTPAYFAILVLSPIVVMLLALFLKRSWFGLRLRGAAANPEAARLAGVFASRMSSLAWALAGALAGFTAILTQPTIGFVSADGFGPSLLLRALAAAVLARMTSLPLTLAYGIGVGVLEQLIRWNYPTQPAIVDAVLFVIILVTLLLQRQRGGRDDEKGSWLAVQALRPLPKAIASAWPVRALRTSIGVAAIVAAALVGFTSTNDTAVSLTAVLALATLGLSVGILSGLAGQLTLGQFAIAGVGAVTAYLVAHASGNYLLAFLYGGLAGAAASLVIGLPALRIRGLMLSVTTLAFALMSQQWLFAQPWLLGPSGKPLERVSLLGHPLADGRSYYEFALGVLVVVTVLAWNVRRSGLARQMIALRDNEDNARAFTVTAAKVKLQAFVLAGFVAGIGGAMYGYSLSLVQSTTFPVDASIGVVTLTVIGGVSLLSGPLVGALIVGGLPLLNFGPAGIAASAFGQLVLILYVPAGVVSVLGPLRDKLATRLAKAVGIDIARAWSDTPVADERPPHLDLQRWARPRKTDAPSSVLLRVRGLAKSFGGIRAVRGVSFDVRAGSIVGLIGPNGAGKTTTFEMVSGFTAPDNGTITFQQQDVTHLSPEERGRLGLIRSFQDAALFPTMTVEETLALAHERVAPTRFFASMLGSVGNDTRKRVRAAELVELMGLGAYRRKQVQELSTGTRRIVELACLMALEPSLLLLDEPSSGIAQRETEALGGLLRQLRDELGTTLLVIEHDIPLIMGLSDVVLAMAEGQLITAGTPEAVRNHPGVVESYLGTSSTAIDRSSHRAPPQRQPASAVAT